MRETVRGGEQCLWWVHAPKRSVELPRALEVPGMRVIRRNSERQRRVAVQSVITKPLARRWVLVGVVTAALVALPAYAATLQGTAGPDVLRGTGGPDLIRAGAANDRVYARAGDDRVYGGAGKDLVYLGRGADRMLDSAGRDHVSGGPGPDITAGTYSADLGRGNDTYRPSRRCAVVELGFGHDVARNGSSWGGIYGCVIRGGPGNDRIAWDGTDAPITTPQTTLYGGPGADLLVGGYNRDILIGGGGADVLRADEFNTYDRLFAGRGNDMLHDLEPGGPAVHCGPGTDTVQLFDLPRELVGCEIVNVTP